MHNENHLNFCFAKTSFMLELVCEKKQLYYYTIKNVYYYLNLFISFIYSEIINLYLLLFSIKKLAVFDITSPLSIPDTIKQIYFFHHHYSFYTYVFYFVLLLGFYLRLLTLFFSVTPLLLIRLFVFIVTLLVEFITNTICY